MAEPSSILSFFGHGKPGHEAAECLEFRSAGNALCFWYQICSCSRPSIANWRCPHLHKTYIPSPWPSR
jgi:hypothetical protein